MAYQITLTAQGGIENFTKASLTPRMPNADEVLIEHHAIGLNFIDIYHRQGLYPLKTPIVIGQEASGIITHTGAEVTDFKVGDRVVYAGYFGAYATHNTVVTNRLIPMPDTVSFKEAASNLLRGATASYLLFDTFNVMPGQTLLVHAGAGGVGQILIQWAKHIGAKVIATVGSEEKRAITKQLGADLSINYTSEDIVTAVRQYSPEGVHVVYDGVGKDTFEASLNSLKRRGLMVSFGNASGAPPALSPLTLLEKGGLFLTRPNLNTYTATRQELELVMGRWLDVLSNQQVKLAAPHEFTLEDVGQAQTALAARSIIGTVVLIP